MSDYTVKIVSGPDGKCKDCDGHVMKCNCWLKGLEGINEVPCIKMEWDENGNLRQVK